MYRFLAIHRLGRRSRGFVTILALASYLGSVWGYPIPEMTKDTSTPFPCQGSRCGCGSAAQCWNECCCFTRREHIDWARKNNVAIPPEILAELSATDAAQLPVAHPCCTQDHTAPSAPPAAREHTACEHTACERGGDCDSSAGIVTDADDGSGVDWISAIQARKCRGIVTLWITSGANLPLVVLPLWQFEWLPRGQLSTADDCVELLSFSPPVPPPRA